MHNLILDIGNTNSKVAVFNGNELLHYQILPVPDESILKNLIEKYTIKNSILSSVEGDFKELTEILRTKTNYIEFSVQLDTGIKNRYKTPLTLGLDRWAKIIAAHRIYPGQNCFMIDAGTCITYDLLNNYGEYFGGSISLGIHMRFEALHHFTERLPLVKWSQEDHNGTIPKGINTDTAIRNGVLQGIINEVEGFIALQNRDNKGLNVIITGGDASFLLKQLKNSIFAPQIIHDPYLVVKGLNEVIALKYVQKN